MTKKMLLIPVLAMAFSLAIALTAYFGLDAQREAVERVHYELVNNPEVLNDLSNPNSAVNQIYEVARSNFSTTIFTLVGIFILAGSIFLTLSIIAAKKPMSSINRIKADVIDQSH